jgi:hypothetical protein
LNSSPHITKTSKSRRIRWKGHEAFMREILNRICDGRLEDTRPFKRLWHRQNKTCILNKYDGRDWIQQRPVFGLVNVVKNFQVPYKAREFLK